MTKSNQLDALGNKSNIPNYPNKDVLEKISNPKIGVNYSIRLTCPEFTSICPVTSQPDFANIYIYSSVSLSRDWLLSYLTSFKDHGDFHEQCIESVFNTILRNFNPKHLEVAGRFQRRGGIDINPVRGTHKKFLFKNFREFNQ